VENFGIAAVGCLPAGYPSCCKALKKMLTVAYVFVLIRFCYDCEILVQL